MLLNNKDYSLLQRFIDNGFFRNAEIMLSLIEKRFIKDTNSTEDFDLAKLAVRERFLKLIKPSDSSIFDELRKAYPIKTPAGRRLHLRVRDCKKLYLETIKDDFSLHKQILKALEVEKTERQARGEFEYMRNLYTYIFRQHWTTYTDDESSEENDRGEQQPKHGNTWL